MITEFPAPHEPLGITLGPDGNLWFTETDCTPPPTPPTHPCPSHVGNITPAGVTTEFSVPTDESGPEFITAGPDGNLWFTEFDANKIGRITTAGVVTEFDIPTPSSRPSHITNGPDGNVWFTESSANKIGRVTTAGVFTEFPIPTASSVPDEIVTGPDGNLWFVEENGSKVGKITPSGVITEYPTPTPASIPGGIGAGPDGNLWFTETDPSPGKVGRITTAGVITEFPIPLPIPPGGSEPLHIKAGPDGNLWFVLENGNRIGRSTTSGSIVEYDLPTPNDKPFDIRSGPDGAMWFTVKSGIGRITTSTPTAGFFTVTPCRLADTRNTDPPALAAAAERTFVLTGACGIPSSAKSVSLNVTVTQPTAAGDIRIHPTGTTKPLVSTLNYRAGQTRANNAIEPLGPDGGILVFTGQPTGTVDFIIDVNGYFE